MTFTALKHLTSTATLTALYLSLTCALLGCGGGNSAPPKGGSPRVSASGNVEFDGEPVPAGTLNFLHYETGYIATCEIDGGWYESESDKGPNPGKNTVSIDGMDADGNRLWQRPWQKEVTIGDSEFSEDFSVPKADVTPFDPASIQIDED